MSEQRPFIIQAAELITTKPFELIIDFFKDKRDRQLALIKLLTKACFETTLEIENIKNKMPMAVERQRAISELWGEVCAELTLAYPPIASQFHEKAVSWARANSWNEQEIREAEKNIETLQQFIASLGTKSGGNA